MSIMSIQAMKVEKDVNQQEVCQLAIKKHRHHDQFFSSMELYVLPYPYKKLVYQVPGTTKMFSLAKYNTKLGKPFFKLTLFLRKRFSATFVNRICSCFQHIFHAEMSIFVGNVVLQTLKIRVKSNLTKSLKYTCENFPFKSIFSFLSRRYIGK